MNKIIIVRNLFLLKNQYLKYLSLILLMPMLFYLINVLFFSDFFTHEIKLWSSIGIWFSCCIMVSYIYIYDIFSIFRINNMNFFVNSPVSIFKILFSTVFFALIIAFVELLVSYSIIYFLNGFSLSFVQFLYLLISISSVLLFFISIGMIFSVYDKHNISLCILSMLCVSFIQFSQILINLKEQVIYVPIFSIIKNIGDYILIPGSDFKFFPVFIMYLISVIFLGITFYISISRIKKIYER